MPLSAVNEVGWGEKVQTHIPQVQNQPTILPTMEAIVLGLVESLVQLRSNH